MASRIGSWNTHVHLFDPVAFPFSSERVYTPPAAIASDLFAASQATNFLIVQATVEKDPSGLLAELKRLQPLEPHRTLRGAILVNDSTDQVSRLEADASRLHAAGIRCIRIHGQFQSPSMLLTEKVIGLLSGRLADVARQYNWCISLRLPIETWASLASYFETRTAGPVIVAEHCGAFDWPLSETTTAAFDIFLRLLTQKLLFVKMGALHRRVAKGRHISELKGPVSKMALAGPGQLLWGSDWPHVDAAARRLEESPFLEVDENEELDILRGSMSEQCFDNMLCATPTALFSWYIHVWKVH